jgi:hypothetical protein
VCISWRVFSGGTNIFSRLDELHISCISKKSMAPANVGQRPEITSVYMYVFLSTT